MCAGTGAGAVNYQMLGAGAVSAPAPALRGLVQTNIHSWSLIGSNMVLYQFWGEIAFIWFYEKKLESFGQCVRVAQ